MHGAPFWAAANTGTGGHKDPTLWTDAQLLAIRGSMWTARLNIPYGPRPNQPDNILAMDYYEWYDVPTRARMIAEYKRHKYTHAVTGPIVDPGGYHGAYPRQASVPSQAQWDHYLDCMQEWWDNDIVPIHFVHPDGWTLAQMQALIPLYQQPGAQRLLRIIVWTGWEPAKYEWPNSYWVQFLQQGHAVMPDAKHLIHTVADVDAPTGGNDYITLKGGNAEAWTNVVPYLHGWLVQNGGYVFGSTPVPDPTFVTNFRNQFDQTQGRASLTSRFRLGLGGWPTHSANGGPLKVYAGEFAAFGDYWNNWPEEEAQKLGDLAMAAGADGVLDGVH